MRPNYEQIGKTVVKALSRKECLCIYRHIPNVSVSAKFCCNKRNFRYLLEIKKDDITDGKTVCAVMQNPSYADEDICDKSVNFLEHLIFDGNNSYFKKISRLLVVNQFAYIKTEDFNGEEQHIGPDNDQNIEGAIRDADIVLIAWGAGNRYKERKQVINNILRGHPEKQLLRTKKHPSLGSHSESFIENYMLPKQLQK